MHSIALSISLESVMQFAEENKYKTNAIGWNSEFSCADPENFLRRDHLPTRGGPTNFIIAKTHILENQGGTEPLIPPLNPPMFLEKVYYFNLRRISFLKIFLG